MANRKNKGANTVKGRFGTFGGVFTPTILTILGLILFLRLGWVVGQAGLAGAIAIIVMANGITLITGLCLSSIATNMFVRTGGLYYMISRTLGLEIGGAIGVPLFLSQAVSVAFYIIGFSEAFTATFEGVDPKLISVALLLFFGILAFVGADFALKIQYLILALLMAAIGSFFLGGWGEISSPTWFAPGDATESFWGAFSIFFPAVTGIAVGVSMSGDLKDPVKSIPRGTLAAIGFSFLIYVGAAIWMATHASPAELKADPMIMERIAAVPSLILLGVWASTLSSALGTVVAAPRTLEAMALDHVAPKTLGNRLGSATEPRIAVLVTAAIALVFILLGDLDFVAPIITMFFLNTYGMINLTAGMETLVGNPSFRPRFKVPWIVSLFGAVGCYGAMFLIHVPATIVAILVSYGIFVLLQRRSLRQDWGDVRGGAWFEAARFTLFQLEREQSHPKNWRPNVVVFTALHDGLDPLLHVGTWLSRGRGMVTFHHLLVGDVDELGGRGLRDTARRQLRKYLTENHVEAFAESSVAQSFGHGVVSTLQAHGIAGIEANTALLGWADNRETRMEHLKLLRSIVALHKSVLFLRYNQGKEFGDRRTIDVWWRGRDRNAELMLLLAHIIAGTHEWRNSKLRLIRVIDNEQGREGAEEHLAETLTNVRVKAEPLVLVRGYDQEPFTSILSRASGETDLVFLGLAVPELEALDDTVRYLDGILQAVPGSALLVRSGQREDVLDSDGGMR